MLVFDTDPFFAGVFGGTGTDADEDAGTGAGPFFAGPFGGVGIGAGGPFGGVGISAGIGAGAPFVKDLVCNLVRTLVGDDGADAVPRTGAGTGISTGAAPPPPIAGDGVKSFSDNNPLK